MANMSACFQATAQGLNPEGLFFPLQRAISRPGRAFSDLVCRSQGSSSTEAEQGMTSLFKWRRRALARPGEDFMTRRLRA
jgi:hypothetical protein